MFVPLETLDRAVRLIDGLAELDDPDRFAEYLLPGLARLVGCDVATYNEVGVNPSRVWYVDFPAGALDPRTNAVFAAYVHEHPLVNYYKTNGDCNPVKISDFLGQAEFHRLGLYSEFFGPIAIEHQIALTLAEPNSTVIGVALNRTRHDFTDQDRAVLGVLRAPLAAGLARVRARVGARRALSRSASDRLAALTARELQILEMVAFGRTNIAIAHALEISPRTVAKHLEHVYAKLDVSGRAAAAARAAPGITG